MCILEEITVKDEGDPMLDQIREDRQQAQKDKDNMHLEKNKESFCTKCYIF